MAKPNSGPGADLPPGTYIEDTDHCEHRISVGSFCNSCCGVVSYSGPMEIMGS